MPIQPSQVISRSNSDLLTIGRIVEMRHVSPAERMRQIFLVAQEFASAVEGCTHDPLRSER